MEVNSMLYLVAHCPMFACNHTNLVCALPSETIPQFEPSVYIAVKCANCGQVFREAAEELEVRHSPTATERVRKDWH
jgi:hypothetical protein